MTYVKNFFQIIFHFSNSYGKLILRREAIFVPLKISKYFQKIFIALNFDLKWNVLETMNKKRKKEKEKGERIWKISFNNSNLCKQNKREYVIDNIFWSEEKTINYKESLINANSLSGH